MTYPSEAVGVVDAPVTVPASLKVPLVKYVVLSASPIGPYEAFISKLFLISM